MRADMQSAQAAQIVRVHTRTHMHMRAYTRTCTRMSTCKHKHTHLASPRAHTAHELYGGQPVICNQHTAANNMHWSYGVGVRSEGNGGGLWCHCLGPATVRINTQPQNLDHHYLTQNMFFTR